MCGCGDTKAEPCLKLTAHRPRSIPISWGKALWRQRRDGGAIDLDQIAQPAILASTTKPDREIFMRGIHRTATAAALSIAIAGGPAPALAWGDEGHEIVALVAQSFLDPPVRKKVAALLAADTDSHTAHDIASEATWADAIKGNSDLKRRTSQWHFVDIEIHDPNVDRACFNHPPIPAGSVAFDGPANDCIIDKIDEFAAELSNSAADPEERVIALKFLLHFIGDLHQPLHASDDNDRGGNDKNVSAPGMRPGNLHHYWDTEFVVALGPDQRRVAADLIESISENQQKEWSKGTPASWAQETFAIARDHAYGELPAPDGRGRYHLSNEYLEMAAEIVPAQLSKAGVRLAFVLNTALAGSR